MVIATGPAGGRQPDVIDGAMRESAPDAAPAPVVDDAFLSGILRASVNPYAVIDERGVVRFVSEPIEDIIGVPASSCVGRDVMDFIVPEHRDSVAVAIAELAGTDGDDVGWTGPPISVDLQHADGRAVPCRVLGVGSGRSEFAGVVVRIRQTATTSKLDAAVAAMITSDDLGRVLDLLLEVLTAQMPGSSGVVGLGWDGSHLSESVAASDVPTFGTAGPLPTDDDSAPWVEALHRNTVTTVAVEAMPEPLARAATAAGFSACWSFPVEMSGLPEHVLVVWRRSPGPPSRHLEEATERLVRLVQLALTADRSRRTLEHQARTDPLTGLANRLALFDRLEDLRRAPIDKPIGVLYCDLDDFKPINDRFGHGTGDRVLTIAAHRISSHVRSGDLVARMGGDEFAVLCVGADAPRLAGLARRLVRSFEEPIMAEGRSVHVGISVGSALFDGTDPRPNTTAILHDADRALLAAKASGKGGWRAAT